MQKGPSAGIVAEWEGRLVLLFQTEENDLHSYIRDRACDSAPTHSH